MREYELVFILQPKIEESGLPEAVGKIVNDLEGEVIQEENWGKRKLSYPIKDFFEGYYYCIVFQSEPDAIREFQRKLRLNDNILRYMITTKKSKRK